jgi:hypothetical protein
VLAQEALRLSLTFGDRIGAAALRPLLGRIAAERGEHILAQEYLAQSLAVGRPAGHHGVLMKSLCTVG